jgi:hypothetical protein
MLSATILTMKYLKSKKQKDKETLASVLKEMAQPRLAKSARKEEEDANHEGKVPTMSTRRLYRPNVSLIVEDNTQERTVDVQPAVVLNEAQLLEFVHEQIDPRTGCADHFRQDLL